VSGTEGSARLDRVLSVHLADLSRSRLKTLILAGQVSIGKGVSIEKGPSIKKEPAGTVPVRDPAYHVGPGDTIIIDVPEAADPSPQGEDIALNIVYEDEDIIVIDKPAGLVVHPAAGHAGGTLVNALIAHCGASLSGIGGVKRPGIVHRLDKDTTGLMVVAKNDRAHASLTAQFADHGRTGEMRRGYLAFAWGAPERPHGRIDRPIDRNPRSRDRMAVRTGGREAVTLWQVLERYRAAKPAGRATARHKRADSSEAVASLLACRLETGRTHQIRVHLASLGHPLLGDPVYGAGFRTKAALLPQAAQAALADLGRQALHAHMLRLKHPLTSEILEFRSELPADLARLHHALVGSRAGTGGE